jgi:Transposase DDE domain group 1
LADTYNGPWTHAPGQVFADLAAAVADGTDCVHGVGQLWADREHVFGPVASTTTLWRLVDERIDADRLPAIRAGRAHARARAWAAGAAPDHDGRLHLDVDATLTVDHSDNENAAATWKNTFGFHSLFVFFDRFDIAAGEALAGRLRPGMRAIIPPPITSPCSIRRCRRCPRPTGPTPPTPTHRRF